MSPPLEEFVAGVDPPMLVVTVRHRGRRDGCLVGFATQTSIDPPRLLVCLSRRNATTRTAIRAKVLAVHQLAATQTELAEVFGAESGDWADKFRRVRWHDGPHGAILLDDVPAWLVGRVVRRADLGDHLGFLLAPLAGRRDGEPPLLHQSGLPAFRPGHPA